MYWRLVQLFCFLTLVFSVSGATFTVTVANDSGAGSLRQAVFDANANPGPDLIRFNILPAGPKIIPLVADGLTLTDPVTIDGSTQPGFAGRPIITLVGMEDAGYGLRIISSNSVIRSLVVTGFAGPGFLLDSGSSGNTIGATNAGAGNVIMGNFSVGVVVVNGTNNAVRGNAISGNGGLGIDLGDDGITPNDGTDADTGANRLQNFPALTSATISSVSVTIAGSLSSRPSTTYQIDFFASQVCDDSGSGEGQAYLGTRSVTTAGSGTASINVTLTVATPGRYITATATDPAGNTSEFSPCLRAASTVSPGTFFVTTANDSGAGSLREAMTEAGARVVNGTNAIHFNIPGAFVHSIAPLSPLPAIVEPLSIDGYTQTGAAVNTLSNGFNGLPLIRLDGSDAGEGVTGLLIASDQCTVRGLVIVGFSGGGIEISGGRSNWIHGNLIGLDADGMPFGNGFAEDESPVASGIRLSGASSNIIGGTAPAARNVISANGEHGIQILGPDAAGNQVLGNFIGTDTTGMVGFANGTQGVDLTDANATIVGGVAAGAGNLISWNGTGVQINGGASNRVQANLIGSDITGTNALGNGTGMIIVESPFNVAGGTNAGARNVILGNGGGIAVLGSLAISNVIQGNFIGTDLSGQFELGNANFGVLVDGGVGNLIGGTETGSGNAVAFNFGPGVHILSGDRNAVLRNSIWGNTASGIDLGGELGGNGPEENDPGDTDSGPNEFQNTPVVTSALVFPTRAVIRGSLDSLPSATFRIQVFDNASCDESGFGEGRTYLTNLIVTTDSEGRATFVFTNATLLPSGHFITATATDAAGNTSEFSACTELVPFDSVDLQVVMIDSDDPASSSSNFTYTITVSNAGPTNAANVVLTNRLPPTLSFVSAAPSQGSCSHQGGIVSCALNGIGNGASATVAVIVHALRGGPAENFVSVGATQIDHAPENNSAVESTLVGIADMAVALSAAPNPAQVGAALTYTLVLTNLGPDPAADVTAVFFPPVWISFIAATSASGTCVRNGNGVFCSFSNLNAQATVSAVVVVMPTVPGPTTAPVSVSTGTSDPDPANDETSIDVQFIPLIRPELSFQHGPGGLTLEWPADTVPGFLLETTTNLAPPATWTIIPGATSPYSVTNSPADRARFYRMRRP